MDENNGELKGGGKGELPEENEGDGKNEYAEQVIQSKKDGKVENAESLSQSKDATLKKNENIQKGRGPSKRKRTIKKSKTSVVKLRGGFRSFGATVKKLWDVWGTFKTKNMQDPYPAVSEKTLGVPGFEEISCIEAEVPDIMMMDKDRVRTSCKECMREPPTFPSKDQIKAKLMAADKYYGVKSAKIKMEQSDTILEHEADYYDVDGTVVRPSWRFILERPLVEQYVLMTNYIRKVSVLSELKEDKHSKKYIEEEDSIDDTEYRKFEQKFIKEKRELLKPILKPKTQDMAVQTSFEPKQHNGEDLKELISEISLYPESEESTNSPEASAVTIVTSRDYTSPLQSDFDGRTTDKSTSYRGGNWWESEASCQPSESFQTSYDSINKNKSSGSDGQSVPIHSTWGKTTLQPARGAFSNESDSQITPRGHSVEPATHRKLKDSKKVSFSSVVTYYQGPNKNGAVYNLPNDEETAMETNQIEPQQQGMVENTPPQNLKIENPPEDQITDEKHKSQEEIPKNIAAEKPKPSNKKVILGDILQDKKPGQIVSVSLPADWSENRILHNNRKMNVVVSRTPAVKQLVSKRISFQEYDEIPDVEYSDSQVSTVQDRTDANIQTQTPVAPKCTPAEKCKPSQRRELSPGKHTFDYQASWNPRQSKIQTVDENPSTAQISNFSTPVIPHIPSTKILNAELNQSRWLGHEKTENIGTETNIQSPPRLISARPTLETLRREEQKFDPHMKKLVRPDRPKASGTAIQQVTFPYANTQTQEPRQMENIPKYEPRLTYTNDKYSRNVTDVNIRSSANPDQILDNHIPRISHSSQQQSTDTEGPSSSSNEHIKLKASPACFFKVATPTDLSKISVDEFYPDVPEIDAELSQISETKTSSAPCVEIVFANKETALRCMKDAEFSRVSREEENAILQRPIKTQDDCPVRLNAPNKGKTITASAGVRIKIDEGQSKSSNTIVSKPSTRNSSQQSSITRSLGKSSITGKQSMRESEENPIIPIEAQTAICETDLGITEMQQATIQGNEVNITVKLKEVEPTTTQPPVLPIPEKLQNDKDVVSRHTVKVSPVATTEVKSNAPTSPDKTNHHDDSSKKDEETPSCKEVATDVTEIDTVHREIEKRGRIEKLDQLANDDDAETLITIQRQVESLPMDPADQVMPHGRTKLYMRTLSSLAEETSSVLEPTSSSMQEKLLDMPVMARSVEELKTIFEKKLEVASISGESEMQVEESRSDSKKYTELSKEKLDNDEASGRLISIEMITPVDDANKTAIKNHLQHKLDKKSFSKSQEGRVNPQGKQNLLSVAVKFDDSNAKLMTFVKSGAAKDESLVRPEGGSHNANSKNIPPSVLKEESSVQQLSQIDVIRASEIYSNTSMYFSSSEDRVAKLSKARTVFQPVTLDDDLLSSSSSRDKEKTANENPEGSNKSHPGSSKNLELEDKQTPSQMNKDSKPQEQGPKLKTNHEGDNFSVGQDSQQAPADIRRKLGKEKGETEEPHTNELEISSGSRTNTNKGLDKDQPINATTKTKSRTDDTSNPSETKQWLMDVIPVLSKNTRFHGFRPHKPVCVKEVTEAEAVKYRQEAVKPVFRFLKRQREMEENKE